MDKTSSSSRGAWIYNDDKDATHIGSTYPLRAFLKLCKDSKFKKWASKYQVAPWEQCTFNLEDPSSKKKYRKVSVLITTDGDLAMIFSERQCACPRGSHEVLQGNTKVKGKSCRRTQIAEPYPKEMARCVARHVMQNRRHVFPTSPLGTLEWKVWNDVPFELRKQIERVHRNLGHQSNNSRGCSRTARLDKTLYVH